MGMCLGSWLGWWCRGGGVSRRRGVCFNRIGSASGGWDRCWSRRGCLEATGDLFQPYRLVDGDCALVVPVAAFFTELAACGRPATTQRSYGMDLLRWFRFLWALGVGWDQATRVEARDFCRWLQVAVKPTPHWRRPDGDSRGSGRKRTTARVNAVTGKAFRGDRYEATTVAHCESVVRGFYDFHLEAGTGPMVNPFPLSRRRGVGRADAHRSAMVSRPYRGVATSRYAFDNRDIRWQMPPIGSSALR